MTIAIDIGGFQRVLPACEVDQASRAAGEEIQFDIVLTHLDLGRRCHGEIRAGGCYVICARRDLERPATRRIRSRRQSPGGDGDARQALARIALPVLIHIVEGHTGQKRAEVSR